MAVLSGAGSWLYGAGQDVLRGLINGIVSMSGAVKNAIERAVNNAVRGALSALGIGSPSKVFAEIGRFSMDGYIVGVNDRVMEVKTSVSNALAPGSGGDTYSTSSTTYGGGGFNGTVIIQVGNDQLTGVVTRVIKDNPQDVSQASEQGARELVRRK